MVCENKYFTYYCEKCYKKYTNVEYEWCKSYQITEFKLSKWLSGNKKIDNLIQEMQLKIDSYNDIVFEWIPYNQFIDIKEVGEGGFAEVYLAIWKDGPLNYDNSRNKYTRNQQNKKVALKCLYNSQNITSEFLNEV